MTTRDLGRMRRGRQIRLLALTCFILALLYTLKQHIATSRSPGNQHTLIQVETSKLRQSLVTSVFLESWQSYRRDCFGSDEYSPISRTCYNLTSGGSIGYTIIDSLDTLWLMGLQSEFDAAERWVSRINFDIDGHYSVFETNIRILGGLLSAYALSQRQTFYDKAVDIGERLYGALVLGTGRKFPQRWVNLHKHEIDKDPVVSTAEIGTLQLELKYLAHITGDKKYWLIAEKIADLIDVSIPESGLATTEMNAVSGRCYPGLVTLGANADSYYEYLLKQYLITGKTQVKYLQRYRRAAQGIVDNLVYRTRPSNLVFTTALYFDIPKHRFEHLECFAGGMFALGAHMDGTRVSGGHGLTLEQQRDLRLGELLAETCLAIYNNWNTGLAPDCVSFTEAWQVTDIWNADADIEPTSDEADARQKAQIYSSNKFYARPIRNIYYEQEVRLVKRGISLWRKYPEMLLDISNSANRLRPETIETLFILWRITGDSKYREYAWEIFSAFVGHCHVTSGGYCGIKNVDDAGSARIDKMETYFLAETLKYLYLLFSDDSVVPLDKFVFNTEAHPLPVFIPDSEWLAENSEM